MKCSLPCRFAVLALAAVLFALAGCATPTQLPSPVMISQPVSLDYVLVNTTNALPDVQAETTQLQDSIISGLRDTGLFANINVAPPQDAPAGGIKILAAIKQITKVSKGARIWYGGLAGKARVVIQVTVSDLATEKPIEEFAVEGHTGASARAGLTYEAIQQASAKVVDEIKRLNVQAAQNEVNHGF